MHLYTKNWVPKLPHIYLIDLNKNSIYSIIDDLTLRFYDAGEKLKI